MRLGFFPVMAGRRAGGPESYEVSLFPELARAVPEDEHHLYCLSQAAANAFGELPRHVKVRVLKPDVRWLSIPFSLPLAMNRDGIELLHVTFTPPPYSPARYVFTVHDVSMFERPEFYPTSIRFRLTRLIRRGLEKAVMVLCVSEHCKASVAERFGIREDRLAVAHHGVSPRFRRMNREDAVHHVRNRFGLDPPFLLHVGKYEKRKNLMRLLEAYDGFRHETGQTPRLVLAGKRDWLASEIADEIGRRNLGESIVELGYVASADLPYLHNAAEMLVFPSLWEGFGLPVIEAMACGLPVIASTVTCLPEIAGDAALYVDPYCVDDLAHAMCNLHRDEALRQLLVSKGLRRAEQFTWRKCAEATADAYRRAADRSVEKPAPIRNSD